jgi:hypothetical protein
MAEPSKEIVTAVSSRLGSPHYCYNIRAGKTTTSPSLVQTLTNPISFQAKGESAAQPASLPNFIILPFFSSFSWRYLAGCEDAEDTRYPKIDTRQRLARHWLMFGFGVRYPVPVPD